MDSLDNNFSSEDRLIEESKDRANHNSLKQTKYDYNENSKWINNQGAEVDKVFGFNQNAELVNGRSAMVGFIMLIITEIVFSGAPVTKSIFGIG